MVFVQNPRRNAQQNCWAESQQNPPEGPECLHDAMAGCCRERDCHAQLRQQVPEDKSQHVNKQKTCSHTVYNCIVFCFVLLFKMLLFFFCRLEKIVTDTQEDRGEPRPPLPTDDKQKTEQRIKKMASNVMTPLIYCFIMLIELYRVTRRCLETTRTGSNISKTLLGNTWQFNRSWTEG